MLKEQKFWFFLSGVCGGVSFGLAFMAGALAVEGSWMAGPIAVLALGMYQLGLILWSTGREIVEEGGGD